MKDHVERQCCQVSRLVIAEKPSVAKTIGSVLGAAGNRNGFYEGGGWIVSWCLGHLISYADPEAYGTRYQNKWEFSALPIIPEEWKTTVIPEKKDRFSVLRKLLTRTDIEYVVNACDAGREGELIFYRVYTQSGSHIPVKRLWVSSMEDSAIRYAFDHLRSGSAYENLRQAAVCRAKADWLVGMNGSRAYSSKYGRPLSVGRVQTPTLAMLVERQRKIDEFTAEPYWTVSLRSGGLTVTSERIDDEGFADALVKLCSGKTGTVTQAKRVRKKMKPPKLYDLTTLQREANRFFGYTARQTLDIAQKLYEAGLITYPRTDSRFITDDMQDTVKELLGAVPDVAPFLKNGAAGRNILRIVNNNEVGDHTAILPTAGSIRREMSDRPEEERNIYYLVYSRLAQAVSPECEYEDTNVTVSCEGHDFMASGRKILAPGWRSVQDAGLSYFRAGKEPEGKQIPDWAVPGAVMENVVSEKDDHMTAPPKPYTEDTLLSAMETAGKDEFEEETERKGLGTPATRASIIEKLIRSGYAERKKKQILPTGQGRALIAAVSESVKSPSLTAGWENGLLRMERGEIDPAVWMDGIYDLIETILEECRSLPYDRLSIFYNDKETVGSCPVCGKPVYETPKSYRCSGYLDDSCRFSLWKDSRYLAGMKKKIDRKTAEALLADGRAHMTGLFSRKTGKTFAADLLMTVDDRGRPQFRLAFPDRR